MKTKKTLNWKVLLFFIVGVEVLGSLSSLFTGNIKEIYNSLSLPPLAPPDYLFGIVWPLLYLLIAISGYLIFQSIAFKKEKATSYILFTIQLGLNFVWSIIFFGGNYYWIGVLIVILLNLVVLACLLQFYRVNRMASLLLMPYFIWILFATYLTIGVAVLN
ncbi:TspO/MBR family protein [Pediococcus ethanolidurans]|uniref:TspO/MBR family protein n=1 Tax=Pediococcus ethanolidurans TaxID=319653 RepID=UPI001C1EF589|nr:TspO/MBR family protein [Pediococcus ethanolidurans]MBU7554027.1 tryptophan-rich sensory protein [Pediococcus ethanolidurans]MBU7563134.1 tryptophan-rich sensory protein [Pediococcus ethanolidurans]MCT4398410.1 tryptophan-rich sensory protein [Pediococcus ethanolidurans]MCV3314996.1 tryptophan-rich sensory protein [Pediococcus ethanolidurans]MCV3322086.1 tryptophan-rich sensory protein [Pediococcus ethanolidurans]